MFSRKALICLIGIDGSGKTTQAHILMDGLKRFGQQVEYKHSYTRKTVLDASKVRRYADIFIKNLNTKTSNQFVALIKTIIRLDSIIIDSLLSQLPNKKTASITISDRYFYDNIVGLATVHSSLASKIILFAKIIPKPTLTIVFQIKPEIAIKRKAEHSIDEARRICDLYYKLSQLTNIEVINAEQDLTTVSKQIEEIWRKKYLESKST